MYVSLDEREPAAVVVVPLTARELLAELDDANQAMVSAEARKLDTIRRLCEQFSTVTEDACGEAAEKLIYHGQDGTPGVAEYLALEVGALLAMSPGAAALLIGTILNCVHRHPVLWDAVQTGAVRWYRATDVISLVNGANLTAAEAQWVDVRITPQLAALPRGRATKLLRGLIATANPAAAREREKAARQDRHVHINPADSDTGPCRDLTARLDTTDALALDATLAQLADVLRRDGDTSPLDHRRASALGILADPARAYQLLGGEPAPSHQRATIVVHISDRALADELAIGRVEGHGPMTRQAWAELLHNDRVTVRPVVDLNAIHPVDSYEIPDSIRDAVTWRTPVDAFPYGTTNARACDLDHTLPYDHGPDAPPGQTLIGNLAPLSRRAHRAKTARSWELTQHPGGWLEWESPSGYRYATGPLGTLRQIRPAA